MSYSKTIWENGDTITAEKLNKIEAGIADGGILIVHTLEDNNLDKSWQQIHDAGFCFLCNTSVDADANLPVESYTPLHSIIDGSEADNTIFGVRFGNDFWTANTASGTLVYSDNN